MSIAYTPNFPISGVTNPFPDFIAEGQRALGLMDMYRGFSHNFVEPPLGASRPSVFAYAPLKQAKQTQSSPLLQRSNRQLKKIKQSCATVRINVSCC
jgi:hypothetical protein